jgi:hypothetical protein
MGTSLGWLAGVSQGGIAPVKIWFEAVLTLAA